MTSIARSIYILIPIHNRKQITLQCLELLSSYHLLEPPYQIIVIDDGSTDGSQVTIEKMYPSVKIITGNGSLWWTGSICKGMKYAYEKGAQFICWLNDDCSPSRQTIPALVQFCAHNDQSVVGCQGYQLLSEHLSFGGKHRTWKGFRMIAVPPGEIQTCDLLSGNLVCFHRTLIDKIGYPDTRLTPHYGGDALFLIRASKADFTLFVDARYPVYDTQSTPSPLYPQHWLTADGDALQLLKLAFTPQSGLSWRLWWSLNWEAYGLWGVVMFSKKYVSLVLLTLGRFLPMHTRKKLNVCFSPKNTERD